MSSSLFGVLTWLGHKETFVENGRRSDDWNLEEHGFCLLEASQIVKSKSIFVCTINTTMLPLSLIAFKRFFVITFLTAVLEDMPLPVAEKDLTQHAGFECREHPVLFGFRNEKPELLTPEAKEASFGLDQWIAYYAHVAKAAKKVIPKVQTSDFATMKSCIASQKNCWMFFFFTRPSTSSFRATRPFPQSSHL